MPQPGLQPDSLCRRFGPSLCLPITPLGPPETDHRITICFISPYLHISLNIQYLISDQLRSTSKSDRNASETGGDHGTWQSHS
jgi:hypothetical protein